MTDMPRAIKAAASALVAAFLSLHTMIQLLVYAIAFDMLTGLLAAWTNGQLCSDVGRKGVGKKLLILLGVAAAEIAGRYLGLEVSVPWGGTWQLGAAVAAYYAIQEAISITENLAWAGVPLPRFITARLAKLRSAAGGTE